jgi:(p)ppGpp synthase/HD superfamily hydrolase
MADPPALTSRFIAAVELASEVHGRQRRKGTRIPYMAHLLVATGLVLEDGGDEDEATAAMLHDAVEDGGGRPMLERITRDFGPRVAYIVEACSDSVDDDEERLPWRARKEHYLTHLREEEDRGVLRVSLADKVHNARSLVRDHREEGPKLWERFPTRTVDDQLWYYRQLLEIFEARTPGPLTKDMREAVEELAELASRDESGD